MGFNRLVPSVHEMITHTWANLQLSAAGLLKYVWRFRRHQAQKA